MQKLKVLHPDPSTDTARLREAFGSILFIHLTRADKVEQAISLVKAEQTGLWHRAADGSELERLSAPQEPVFDAGAIARHIAELSADDQNWDKWFEREGVTPLRVTYDALSKAPGEMLSTILGALGADVSLVEGIDPPTARLSDDVSRLWADRFRSEQES